MRKLLVFFVPLISSASELREERVAHAGAEFRIVRIPPQDLQIVWKDAKGEPYRTFDKVQASFAEKGKTVTFLMNAGIFEPGGIPSGLHIENGKEWLPPNAKDGQGNFFLKPNGIVSFWIGRDGGPSISTLDAWNQRREISSKARDLRAPQMAAQSGPLLLIGGKRHPAFREGSESRLHRNGIGINQAGEFVCAITVSGQMANLWDFAGLFIKLGCQDALFLDGDISQMAVQPDKPIESNPFGAIFVVTR